MGIIIKVLACILAILSSATLALIVIREIKERRLKDGR